jgi:F-type H+-transporting ATPase subunit b
MKLSRLVFGLLLALAAIGWLATASPGAAAAVSPAASASTPPAEAGHTDAHGGGHGEEAANPLEIKSDLAIWTAVVFVVLLLVLGKFAWGPVVEGLDKREQYIAAQIAHAEQNNAEARRLLDEYQQKLSGAQGEVRAIIDQARHEAEQVGREMIEKARLEAKHELEKGVREIEQASAAALAELAQRSATLAVQLAGKIVGAKLQPADHAALIQQTVADFVKAQPSNN